RAGSLWRGRRSRGLGLKSPGTDSARPAEARLGLLQLALELGFVGPHLCPGGARFAIGLLGIELELPAERVARGQARGIPDPGSHSPQRVAAFFDGRCQFADGRRHGTLRLGQRQKLLTESGHFRKARSVPTVFQPVAQGLALRSTDGPAAGTGKPRLRIKAAIPGSRPRNFRYASAGSMVLPTLKTSSCKRLATALS